MLKRNDDIKGIDVEITLTDADRATLGSVIRGPGFDVLQRLMEDQVRKFNLKLINTNPANKEDVIANHFLAKSVAQFYMGLMSRLDHELQIESYNNSDIGTAANPENNTQIEEVA